MEEINPQTNYTTKAFYTAEEYKRLEQENAELKEKISKNKAEEIGKETYLELKIKKYKQALEEIREYILCYQECYEGTPDECINKIKEVLGND